MAEQWYQLSPEDTVQKLRTSEASGLDPGEAADRLERFGPNKLAEAGKVSLWTMFISQFKDFMVLILLAATVVSGFLHEWADAITIMIIITLNAALGVYQEFRAERSIEALKQLTAPEAKVVRGGGGIENSYHQPGAWGSGTFGGRRPGACGFKAATGGKP